jgi:hypothetical protein
MIISLSAWKNLLFCKLSLYHIKVQKKVKKVMYLRLFQDLKFWNSLICLWIMRPGSCIFFLRNGPRAAPTGALR